jgi:hypothetical protein
MTEEHTLFELTDVPGDIAAQWYSEDETLQPQRCEMVIDLSALTSPDTRYLHGIVWEFLFAHGLDAEHSTDMADKLIAALPTLHPATLGVVVRSLPHGHWQIVAERGQ